MTEAAPYHLRQSEDRESGDDLGNEWSPPRFVNLALQQSNAPKILEVRSVSTNKDDERAGKPVSGQHLRM